MVARRSISVPHIVAIVPSPLTLDLPSPTLHLPKLPPGASRLVLTAQNAPNLSRLPPLQAHQSNDRTARLLPLGGLVLASSSRRPRPHHNHAQSTHVATHSLSACCCASHSRLSPTPTLFTPHHSTTPCLDSLPTLPTYSLHFPFCHSRSIRSSSLSSTQFPGCSTHSSS